MRFVISIMLLLIASVAFAQEAPPPAGSAERGANSYRKYMCYTCHGTVGQGATAGVGSKLAPGTLPYPAFALQVRAPRQDMPAYRTEFVSDQELADMYAYLLTVKPSAAAKDIPLLKFD